MFKQRRIRAAFLLSTMLLLASGLAAQRSRAAEQAPTPAPMSPADKAALARSRLYRPPALPPEANAVDVDNVYSMQMLTLPKQDLMQKLGRRIFFDPALSGSGKLSCSSCHNPDTAYGPDNALPVQMGGTALDKMGNRAAPSLRYKERLPAFSEHYFDEEMPTGIDQGPTGGFGLDGRFSTLHAQVSLPLLAPNEMANASVSDVVAKLRRAEYAPLFRETFGADALDDEGRAFKWMTLALEYFQRDPKEFFPFSSKYDAYLRGQASLTPSEQRGLKLFNDKEKGNCATCHPSARSPNGAMPDFTDFGLVAVGAPRNSALSINKQADFYDLGLCGPYRTDMARHREYCGAFRTPTLRNVALRKSFMHNGVFHSLLEVLDFYATRDTDPARWYPRIAAGRHKGEIDKYNDLPRDLRKNVNQEAPFSPDAAGKPRLSKADVDDLAAFLATLTDGYRAPPDNQMASANGNKKEQQ
ncbi:MAG TPA: cytochrome c peroxidase [Burkholderiaceae bacterium]